jgi:STE24 endopeptidase
VTAVATAGAGLLALSSRTPEEVRSNSPGKGATRAELGARFSDEQIARHGAYRGPTYLSFALSTVLNLVVLLVLARGPFGRLIDRLQTVPGGIWVRVALAAVAVMLVGAVASLPLSYVRGYAMEHAWGLSTQDFGGWMSDQGRAWLVGAIEAAVAANAFYAVLRWQPRFWWLWGWAAFTLLTAVLVFVWPVVVAPLFNQFTPLPDEALVSRIKSVAGRAGVDIDQVLVADASRRTRAENAYVAGLGATKRMVLYDTLLGAGSEDETMFVVAHELGHEAKGHVLKGVALSSAGLFAGFALLALLAGRGWPWSWAGASGVSDLRALPVLLLFVALMALVTLPFESTVSRRFETQADSIAISLTNDPEVAVESFRRLAFANLADLAPPKLAVTVFYSHPPIPTRIRAVLADERKYP